MKKIVKAAALVIAGGMLFVSCASTPKTNRVAADTITDLTEFWNDNDVDIVCKDLIGKFLDSPRIAQFQVQKKRLPVIRVGTFKNASSEPIDTTIISKRMQVQIVNSGKAKFVADSSLSEALRSEAADQQSWAKEKTTAAIAAETGADFLLTGAVTTIIQTQGSDQIRFYDVTAEATDITTHEIFWTDENKSIKKIVSRKKIKF
ncbi:hypothetical protein FACS1894190_10780 [Spirochaetia bacterium]|nr:hypothetical protein FACS1894190_10780 [Spirochaetia bacterium]